MKRLEAPSGRLSLTGLYSYIWSMVASQALTNIPLYGGALYMCGRVATVYGGAYGRDLRAYLPPRMLTWRWVLLVVLALVNITVLVLYPLALDQPGTRLVLFAVAMVLLRDGMCRSLSRRYAAGQLSGRWFSGLNVAGHGLLLAIAAGILLYNLPGMQAWPLLAGYVLCSLSAFSDAMREQERLQMRGEPDENPAELRQSMRSANAYVIFSRLSTLVLSGMEMTLIVMYTCFADSVEMMLIRMPMAVVTTLLCREAAEWYLQRRRARRRGEPVNLLLLGLALWLAGLVRFGMLLAGHGPLTTTAYVCLALCSGGSALCQACIDSMEQPMQNVARYATGDLQGYGYLRHAGRELASLMGQMLALVVLCIMIGTARPATPEALLATLRPEMIVPPLITVVLALLCALRFPVSSRQMDKLGRLLHIRERGEENAALETQMQSVIMQRHTQPLVIRALMAVLRPFYRHKLKGVENIRQDEDNPIVFLCNHGEVYGPVTAMLFCPVPVRPWSMSELCGTAQETAEYTYKYTYSQIRWLGPLRWPLAKLVSHISVWCFHRLECVPVYRNKPRELMTTFRKSVEAMQAGDNLLIFPENPDADPDAPGYEDGRPGELFRGFPMMAQVYYSRTGKRCRFLPMLAHKGARSVSFGTEIVYDPDANPIEERNRIVDEASRQMQELFDREEAVAAARR